MESHFFAKAAVYSNTFISSTFMVVFKLTTQDFQNLLNQYSFIKKLAENVRSQL